MSDHHDRHRAYSLLTASFNIGLAVLATRRRAQLRLGRSLPWQDLALLGIATQKVSRVLARDRVTAPLRAPVTEGEKQLEPTGEGAQRALGELVTCPYCMTPWISLGVSAAYVLYPVQTRVASAVLCVASASDFLNRTYANLSAA